MPIDVTDDSVQPVVESEKCSCRLTCRMCENYYDSSLTEYIKEKPENTGVLYFTYNTYHYTC